jgi:ATP-binding cassette, subfamily B, multidrug efflux pump
MLKLLRFLKPYSWQLLMLLILVCIQVAVNLQLPDYTAKIINEGIIQQNTGLIWHNGWLMLLISLVGGVATIGVGYLASRAASGFSRDVRNAVFERVENFSLTEFNTFSTASLITRTTNDIQQMQTVIVMLLRMVVAAPITAVFAVIKAYNTAPSMSWIMALAIGVMVVLIVFLFAVAMPKFKLIQILIDRLNLVARENLTGLRVVRAFNNENYEEKKFDGVNNELTVTNVLVNRLMAIMQPMMMLVFNITSVVIVWVGAHLLSTGSLQVGDMLAFMQYAIQTIMSFLMISMVFIMVPRASVSGKRISEVLETKPIIIDPENPKKLAANSQGNVEFLNVTFSYPGAQEPVLKNISFTASPGETTAFIGSTGSGKSTIVNLIPRFYDVSEGKILVDGIDIRELKLEDLYAVIGYVPQKGTLFSGDVTSNIKYGAPAASVEEVEKAASIAQATEFITKLDGDFKASIAQGGANVSGGQKQRLSIARAIVRKPNIYIFDDSFSALDFKTDANLRKALEQETKGKTVLIVGQRIATIMNAAKIVVLEDGQIAGIGTHKELLRNCGVYRQIAESQLSEDELRIHTEDSSENTFQMEEGYPEGQI